jgi:hypothetical protein
MSGRRESTCKKSCGSWSTREPPGMAGRREGSSLAVGSVENPDCD